MDILCLLATAALAKEVALTKGYERDTLPEPLPLMHEIVQATPVHQLEGQSISESFIFEQNERWNSVEALETPVSDLDSDIEVETQKFSPTVLLEGEAILGVSGASGGDLDGSVVFQESVELILNVSFTGEDRLKVGIESGNAMRFSFVDKITFEGRLSFPSDTNGNRFELSELSYEFPVGDRASVYISTSDNDLNDFNPFLGDSSDGAISEFGTENPIHSLVDDFGLQLNYDLTDELSLSLGYFTEQASDSEAGAGLFNGNQSAFVQLKFEPSDSFLLGLTYIHTYDSSSLETEIGSLRSQINLERPVIGNSYGISVSFAPSSRFVIGGWVGLTNATVIDLGNADIWNYALTLALLDLGKEGNLLGVVIGQEPRLTGTSGFMIDDRTSDPDISLHIEAFYSHHLSDHVSVTPGLIWITAPNHDRSNSDILVFTVRTTFEF